MKMFYISNIAIFVNKNSRTFQNSSIKSIRRRIKHDKNISRFLACLDRWNSKKKKKKKLQN